MSETKAGCTTCDGTGYYYLPTSSDPHQCHCRTARKAEEIEQQTRVEHTRSGEQGVVVARSRAFGVTRYHIDWDNIEFDTPGGITADRLVVIKRPQVAT